MTAVIRAVHFETRPPAFGLQDLVDALETAPVAGFQFPGWNAALVARRAAGVRA